MGALPGVAVADTQPAQGLASGPEPDARGSWIGVVVPDQHRVDLPAARQLAHEARGRNVLQFSLELEVESPRGKVVHEEEATDGIGYHDFGGQCRAREVGRARRQVQVELIDARRRVAGLRGAPMYRSRIDPAAIPDQDASWARGG
jgi:hypothetical protein